MKRLGVLAIGMALGLGTTLAEDKTGSIEKTTKVHRLASTKRAVYDAFVYANRIPEKTEEGETASDLAGRILGRLANQEGRVLLKVPPGMDRAAYEGYKTFLRDEGPSSAGNCIACHTPPNFTPGKAPSLRNLSTRKLDLEKVLRAKMTASAKRQDGYAATKITPQDFPSLIAFLRTLNDVPEDQFRDLIVKAQVLDTSEEYEAEP